MAGEERVAFDSRGARIEGMLHMPPATPAGVIVFCHPHPLYGGTMSHPVVRHTCVSAAERGLAALRFNFRGAGNSTGVHTDGKLEVDDVLAAMEFLTTRFGEMPLGVGGYSFGSVMGVGAAMRTGGVDCFAAVAPPLAAMDMDSMTSWGASKFFILGDRDEICPTELFGPWYDRIAEPKESEILEGVDHFFGGVAGEVGRKVADYFYRALAQ